MKIAIDKAPPTLDEIEAEKKRLETELNLLILRKKINFYLISIIILLTSFHKGGLPGLIGPTVGTVLIAFYFIGETPTTILESVTRDFKKFPSVGLVSGITGYLFTLFFTEPLFVLVTNSAKITNDIALGTIYFGICTIVALILILCVFILIDVSFKSRIETNFKSFLFNSKSISASNAAEIVELCKVHPEIDKYRSQVVSLHRPLVQTEFKAMQKWAVEITGKAAFEHLQSPGPIQDKK
jgi:hypothetical protein